MATAHGQPRARAAGTVHGEDLLTARERTVLRLVVERYDNQDIAASLGISKRTVETHVAALLRKLAMPDRRTLISLSGTDGFRARLAALLRSDQAPDHVQPEVAELVGRHLGADRAHFQLIDPDADAVVVCHGWTADQPAVLGRHRLSDFCDHDVRRSLAVGRTLVVRDAHRDLTPVAAAAWARLSVRAALTVFDPWEHRAPAALSVTSATPRDWGPDDVTLLEETAERTWAHAERWRLRTALHAERHRFELVAESAATPVCRTDPRGHIGWTNPAFRAATGLATGDVADEQQLPSGLRASPELGPGGRVEGYVLMPGPDREPPVGPGGHPR